MNSLETVSVSRSRRPCSLRCPAFPLLLLSVALSFSSGVAAAESGASPKPAENAVKAEDGDTPQSKMQAARKLAMAGKHAEALELYLWCYDSGPSADPKFVLNGQLPLMMGMLGNSYPPALEALRVRRAPLQQTIFADPKSAQSDAVTLLADLDLALKDDPAILSALAKLPQGSRARKDYGSMQVLIRLVDQRHYREALSLGVPETEYEVQAARATKAIDTMKAGGRVVPEKTIASLKKAPAMLGGIYVTALAGAGETERAHKLATRVLQENGDPAARKLLDERLKRAGLTDFAASLPLAADKTVSKNP